MKFRQNIFPGEPNPNILCIGGCDPYVLETLDIGLSSVKQTNQNNRTILTNNRPNPNTTLVNRPNPNTTLVNRAIPRSQPTNPRNRPNTSLPGPSRSQDNPNSDETIVCSCNVEAVQLTVRKEGPNTGRQFYGCATKSCSFFLWAPDRDAPPTPAPRPPPNPTGTPNCNCELPAVQRTVSKDGPNKGRPFYCCSKGMGQGCNFFKWADEVGYTVIKICF